MSETCFCASRLHSLLEMHLRGKSLRRTFPTISLSPLQIETLTQHWMELDTHTDMGGAFSPYSAFILSVFLHVFWKLTYADQQSRTWWSWSIVQVRLDCRRGGRSFKNVETFLGAVMRVGEKCQTSAWCYFAQSLQISWEDTGWELNVSWIAVKEKWRSVQDQFDKSDITVMPYFCNALPLTQVIHSSTDRTVITSQPLHILICTEEKKLPRENKALSMKWRLRESILERYFRYFLPTVQPSPPASPSTVRAAITSFTSSAFRCNHLPDTAIWNSFGSCHCVKYCAIHHFPHRHHNLPIQSSSSIFQILASLCQQCADWRSSALLLQ